MTASSIIVGIDRQPPVGARQHPDAPNIYVGPDGSIWQRINITHPERRQWLRRKMEVDKHEYLRVRINTVNRFVHREVYRVFCGSLIEGLVICHLDGSRQNNSPSNLLQTDQRTNIAHKRVHGTEQIGSRHGNAIHTESVAKTVKDELVRAKRSRTGRLAKGEAQRIADVVGTDLTFVHDLSRNRPGWRHVL